jgi:hypothetical protein
VGSLQGKLQLELQEPLAAASGKAAAVLNAVQMRGSNGRA